MSTESRLINGFPFDRFQHAAPSEQETVSRAAAFYQSINARRSVRDFSSRPVPEETMRHIIMAAASAPSGAHKQPWTFCLIKDPAIKKQIREAAEKEEFESYTHRMDEIWLKDLQPLQTDWHKPFLETAPWLIVVFRKPYEPQEDGTTSQNYYVQESVGIACGFLIAAIHHAGLCALTHTPSPMNFLGSILNRPAHERPYLLIPVGYPAEETWVPSLTRKPFDEVSVVY